MPRFQDGPATGLFQPVRWEGGLSRGALAAASLSPEMKAALPEAPEGECVCRGIPFSADHPVLIQGQRRTVSFSGLKARWLIFLHTTDRSPLGENAHGFISPMRGEGRLGEIACTYRLRYQDGHQETLPIVRRRQISVFARRWGENSFDAVGHAKPRATRAPHEQLGPEWGRKQTRVDSADFPPFLCWLWAWENPRPNAPLTELECEPGSVPVVLFGMSGGDAGSNPLRWEGRSKAILTLPAGVSFSPDLDESGLLRDVSLDLGQVISAQPRPLYPNDGWDASYNNMLPRISDREVLIEYTAHPEAVFHIAGGRTVPASGLAAFAPASGRGGSGLASVAPSRTRVRLRIVERGSSKPVPVKLHVHGEAGEYLAPVDRHRIPNHAWFEDYSVDFSHRGQHWCTYIDGETVMDLPLGPVHLEASKGFEIKPVRKRIVVDGSTSEITVELDRVLPWRARGWVTADTHVHFLSPVSALLEGAAEGVNVVNLLASQWGELMTNVGDFDGKTTWGSREAGGDGEHLVRVGTENRQHVLGHISLLGYEGRIIAPMTTGGPDESALGDPVGALLSDWAEQCKARGGVVIVPHFPNPRAEHAAALVGGRVDGVEMTAWGNLYGGIDPYSLSDWYRYLNCGYLVAAVGGTDKMSSDTAVGTVRTYARIQHGKPFSYDEWKEAVRRCETFVTYGPLIELTVDGKPMGSRFSLSGSGGTLDIEWRAQSVTVPMSRVELVVNGEIRESVAADPWTAEGRWQLKADRSSWVALLVRGHYPDQPEIVAAHSSPVMVQVGGGAFMAAADALTILEQIEGALAYLDTVGTRADTASYRRMRMVLESAHRSLHNRMHQAGHYHEHTPPADHPEHHR